MNKQINLRLPDSLLKSATKYAEKHGFGSVQDFIKETLREKLFGPEFTKEEMALAKKIYDVTEKNNLWRSEEELEKALE